MRRCTSMSGGALILLANLEGPKSLCQSAESLMWVSKDTPSLGVVEARLDRLLVNMEWRTIFSDVVVHHLPQ